MNIEQARFNMIEQQIRTWDVLDQDVLDLLAVVKREEFVPVALRALAFIDMELPLPVADKSDPETMFAPKVEARLLQELALKGHETALEIGSGSGYMAALLAHKAKAVVTVEILPELVKFATDNLTHAGVFNVKVEQGDGVNGWPAAGQVDVIAVSGSVPMLPEALLRQLKIGGRMTAIVGDRPVMTAQLITRIDETSWEKINLFETVIKPLRNAPHPPRFKF